MFFLKGNYVLDTPAIQFFHIYEKDGEGGDTVLADGFNFGKELSQKKPDLFKYFSETKIPYHYLGDDSFFFAEYPVFKLCEKKKEIVAFHFNNDDRAPPKNWSLKQVGNPN